VSENGPRQGRLSALRRLSDEELGAEASTGDERAARVLLERFEGGVYRYVLALVRDPDVAREAAGSALIEAGRALRAGEHSDPVAPWLYKIAGASAYLARDRAERDQAAELAASAEGGTKERLEGLLSGLAGLGALELSALLLREMARLDYVGIGTAAGSRPPVARQAVYRARLALQGDVEPPTEHCDEIRGAMSKAEVGFRERKSIASHLEDCPVCEQFAVQLEQRPEDLRALFPPPSGSLAAEFLPSMAAAAGAGAGLAAAAAAQGAGGADRPSEGARRRRPMLVPLILALLLIGAAIGTALALQDSGGGKKSEAGATSEARRAKPSKPKSSTPAEGKGAEPGKAKSGAGAGAGSDSDSDSDSDSGSGSEDDRSNTPAGPSSGRPSSRPEPRREQDRAERRPCPRPAVSPARSAYSGRAGAVQAELRPCVQRAGAAAGGGLAGTGLDLTPLLAVGLGLLALGFGLRRLTAPR
jgi:RNA polymerase sigma-70 factor (ECF subfamily)